jgi:hypothetical protein
MKQRGSGRWLEGITYPKHLCLSAKILSYGILSQKEGIALFNQVFQCVFFEKFSQHYLEFLVYCLLLFEDFIA